LRYYKSQQIRVVKEFLKIPITQMRQVAPLTKRCFVFLALTSVCKARNRLIYTVQIIECFSSLIIAPSCNSMAFYYPWRQWQNASRDNCNPIQLKKLFPVISV